MDAKSDIYFLLFTTHAADHALTLLRIHRRTLCNARAACKMVCKARLKKMLLRFFNNEHLNGFAAGNKLQAKFIKTHLLDLCGSL